MKSQTLLDRLEILLSYYKENRQVGHTTLMREGVSHYDKEKLVLTHSLAHSNDLGCKDDEIISWNSIDKLRGHKKPIAIDNATMFLMLSEAISEIEKINKENEELRKEISKFKQLKEKISEVIKNIIEIL